jgi:hypothetical protein
MVKVLFQIQIQHKLYNVISGVTIKGKIKDYMNKSRGNKGKWLRVKIVKKELRKTKDY